ncbi:MAG: hypothetical protein PVI90_06115 [Desulfobacteraceae bacterium]
MAAFNIQGLAICCINALPTKIGSVVKAIDSTGEEFWYSPENYAISPEFAFKKWTKKKIIEMFNAGTNAKELKKQYSTKSISNKRLNRIIIDICEMLRS